MIKKILSAAFIIATLAIVICTPLSAIFIICKLCAALTFSWIACCIPLIISLSCMPTFIIAKLIIDAGANDGKTGGKNAETKQK